MASTSRLRAFLLACTATGCCAVLLLATSPRLALVWDEGDTIARAEQIAKLDRRNWPYTVAREGHPPLAGIVIAVGSRLAPPWFDPLTRARFGPILLFSLAAGAMFYRLQRDYGVAAVSIMAIVALLTMPRLFAHAHYATLDGPLTAAWILAWATFTPACGQGKWSLPFGVALGLALCAKFTGWLVVLPLITWTLLYRDRGGARALAIGIPIAVAVFLFANPPLWSDPLSGLRTFFDLNLHRAAQAEHNVTTWFFGRMYDLDHPLPWYNTLVWTAITVTPIVALFGVVGIVASVRLWRSDRAGMLLVLNWATLIVVRALPMAPPHDAERLILPSFAFFAALAGVGIGRALYRGTLLLGDRIPAQGWAKVAMTIAIAASAFDAIHYFPHNLSYYSRIVGGLRGAAALGLEPTYYWDALDRDALAWLARHTADDEKIAFGAAPPRNLELLKRWGLLARLPDEPGRFRWYVIQRRPSAWQSADRWLVEHQRPAFQRMLWSVPLLDVYAYEQYRRAFSATAGDRK